MDNGNILIGIAFNAYDPITGSRGERVSEESVAQVAEEVYESITSVGYSAAVLPLSKSLMSFLRRLKELKVDLLINLCEGFLGRPQFEANVAAVFEMLGITFTGNNSKSLAICQDKFRAKAVLHAYGLPTAKGRMVTSVDQPVDLAFPLIVKPNSEDASLGIYPDSVVYDEKSLSEKVKKIVDRYKQPALVEEYIEGREFNVAIIDGEKPEALPVSEIDFSAMPKEMPKICSYEAKWFEDHFLYNSTPPICPAQIEDSLRDRLQQVALAAFQVMSCRDYVRVDIRMGKDGRLYILEVNPNPDISHNAGYARALRAAEIGYAEFWTRMIEKALSRKEQPWYSLDYAWDNFSSGAEAESFWRSLLESALSFRRKEKRWFGP